MVETSKETLFLLRPPQENIAYIVHIRFFQGEWQQQRFSVFFEYKGIDGRFQKEQSTIRKCAGTQEGGNIFKSFNQSLQVSLRP